MFSLGRAAGTMTATIAIKAKATEIKRTVAARLGAMPLSDFLAACRSRLWAVVLAEDQRLVGVKRARACGAEDRGGALDAVALRRSREGESVAVPFAGGQIRRNQIRRRGIVDSAGRRSQFSERPGVSSELGIVLHLRGVEGLKRLESSRLLSVHPRSVHVALSQGGRRNRGAWGSLQLQRERLTGRSWRASTRPTWWCRLPSPPPPRLPCCWR